MISDLQVENLKDLVLESLPPEEARLIDIKRLVQHCDDYNVATLLVKDEVARQIRLQDNDEFYKPIYRSINKMKDNCCNAAFIKGPGGMGKSYNIKRALELGGQDYKEVNGQLTEAYLYRTLYENNGKVIWFRDLSKLLAGLGSVNLLKAATEMDAKRTLTTNTYSHQQSNLPKSFEFKGKLLFDYNDVRGDLKADFEALLSRGDYIHLNFQPDEVAEIMRNIAATEKELETTEYAIKNCAPEALNLRVQQKAIMTRDFSEKNNLDWKEEVGAELKKYKGRDFYKLFDIMGDKPVTTVQLKKKLMQAGMVNSLRSAHRKVSDLEFTGLIKKADDAKRNYKVKLNW